MGESGRAKPTTRCRWCGRPVEPREGPGRPRSFCRAGCRQQSYMARKLAKSHGLDDDDVIVDRSAIEELQGLLYCLQAAVEDVQRDLAASSTAQDLSEALTWLMENAVPLAAARLEPRMAAIV